MTAADPRTALVRPGFAERRLEGVERAAAYRDTIAMQCSAAVASLRLKPEPDAEQADQLVFGEVFDVLEEVGDWAFGRARRDGYVGWVLTEALSQPVLTPTHRVSAIRTYAFAEPVLKAAPVMLLTLNALVTAVERTDRYVRVERMGWIPAEHLAELHAFETDPVAVAERYLGAPYQWGGRESLGLDCSGLLQQALYACGRACPRDADQQLAEAGRPIEPRSFDELERGDLVFWDGHVAIVTAPGRVLHANAHHMAVAVEALTEVAARMREAVGEPTGFRRL